MTEIFLKHVFGFAPFHRKSFGQLTNCPTSKNHFRGTTAVDIKLVGSSQSTKLRIFYGKNRLRGTFSRVLFNDTILRDRERKEEERKSPAPGGIQTHHLLNFSRGLYHHCVTSAVQQVQIVNQMDFETFLTHVGTF